MPRVREEIEIRKLNLLKMYSIGITTNKELSEALKVSMPKVIRDKKELVKENFIEIQGSNYNQNIQLTTKGMERLGLNKQSYKPLEAELDFLLTDEDIWHDRKMSIIGYLELGIKTKDIANILELSLVTVYKNINELIEMRFVKGRKPTISGLEVFRKYQADLY